MARSDVPDIQIESVGRTVCPRCGIMIDVSGVSAFSTAQCKACGAEFAAPGKLAQYVLLRPIGQTRTTVSFKGFDTSMSRHVEVKVLLKEPCGDPEQVRAFQAEARALASLDNRCVARAFFVGDEAGRPYCVAELVEGKALSQLISPDKPISETGVLKIAIDVAGVIRDLADKGMCHGRISPDSIILVAKGAIKVVNFSGESAEDDDSAGARQYVAPEQVGGKGGSFNADIYSLGATMFHALTGSPAFSAEAEGRIREAQLTSSAPDVRSVRSGLGRLTAEVVGRMLRGEPAERYENCPTLLEELESALTAAETARRARGGDPAAALSVLTGERSRPARPDKAARPRKATRQAKSSAPESPDDKVRAARKKRLVLYAAPAAAAIVLATVLVLVLWPSPETRGGESFSGSGPEASVKGPGLVVVKGFDLAGWSVKKGRAFNDGAFDLFNGNGADRSISRKIPPGPFKIRIDLKNMVHGFGMNYDIRIEDPSGVYVTFSIKQGMPVVGAHHSAKGWQCLADGKPTEAPAVSWEIELAEKDGAIRWAIMCKPKGEPEQILKMGHGHLAHYIHYRRELRIDVPRTVEIVSRGPKARMSVDHYERIK